MEPQSSKGENNKTISTGGRRLLAFLYVALVAAAFVATLAVGRGLGPWRVPAATLAAVAVLVVAPLLWFSRYLSVDQLVGGYVGEFASATGLHPSLAKALAAALVIPALVGATRSASLSSSSSQA